MIKLLFLLFPLLVSAQSDSILVLKNVSLIIGDGSPMKEHANLVIMGDTIASISYGENFTYPGAKILDYENHYIMPGLVDAHVHISDEQETLEDRTKLEELLEFTIRGGVTSIRDMAGDNRILADVSRAAMLKILLSPDIYYSALFAGPEFFSDPRTHMSAKGEVAGEVPWMKAITSTTNMELAVAEAKGTGASAIKIYGALDNVLVDKITKEAHKQGMLVWSHATVFPASPSDMITAGVDAVSHGTLLIWEEEKLPESFEKRYKADYSIDPFKSKKLKELLEKMAQENIILDATVFVYQVDPKDTTVTPEQKARAKFACEITKLAHSLGVLVAAGSDNLGNPGEKQLPNLYDEIELLVNECGFQPMEAIRAATQVSAMATGIIENAGTLEVGKKADLLILNKSPIQRIENIRTL
ncbi:MAG: amidohydrolase family protein, partial [Bacteroidia bacterium]|nr:amidohydrolase family protein [Bacteroidia bacterium]